MIRTLVAHSRALVRGALAFVLSAEADIEVVAQIGRVEHIAGPVHAYRPHVTVLDLDLLLLDDLPRLWARYGRRTCGSAILVLAEARQSRALGPMMAGQPPGVGFLAKEGPPQRLVAAVRAVSRDEQVLDPELVVSALQARCPLTPRESQVLSVAAEGVAVAEIAQRLVLAPGTVRNHLSRVIGKTGARTSIEAVRIAQDAGWI